MEIDVRDWKLISSGRTSIGELDRCSLWSYDQNESPIDIRPQQVWTRSMTGTALPGIDLHNVYAWGTSDMGGNFTSVGLPVVTKSPTSFPQLNESRKSLTNTQNVLRENNPSARGEDFCSLWIEGAHIHDNALEPPLVKFPQRNYAERAQGSTRQPARDFMSNSPKFLELQSANGFLKKVSLGELFNLVALTEDSLAYLQPSRSHRKRPLARNFEGNRDESIHLLRIASRSAQPNHLG
jgi:hypothetical protein